MTDELTKAILEGLPEAPASLNTRVITSKGYVLQITLRDLDEGVLMDRFAELLKKLDAWKCQPANGYGKPATQAASPPQAEAPTMRGAPEVPYTADDFSGDESQAEYDEFDADILEASTNKGKTYWKVKGGRWSKFGVTIWPEAIKDAGFTDDLDPAKEYDLRGYTATALMEDGKPKKIVKLAKS